MSPASNKGLRRTLQFAKNIIAKHPVLLLLSMLAILITLLFYFIIQSDLPSREKFILVVALTSAATAVFAPIIVARSKERREALNLELFIKTDILLRRSYLENTICYLHDLLKRSATDSEWQEPFLVIRSNEAPVVNLTIDKKDLNIKHLDILFMYYQNHSGTDEIQTDLRSPEFKALDKDRKLVIYRSFLAMFEQQLELGDLYLEKRYGEYPPANTH